MGSSPAGRATAVTLRRNVIGRFAHAISAAEPRRPARGMFPVWAAGLAVLLFVVAWWLLSFDWHVQHPDLGFYQSVGEATAAGKVPYRDFDPAYPPAALPILVLPSLLGATPGINEEYAATFEQLTMLLGIFLVAGVLLDLVALSAGRTRTVLALSFVALSPLLVGSIMPARYDVWPAALTAVGLAAVLARHDRIGSAVLGFAVMAKVYPLAILPLVVAHVWRRQGVRAALADAGLAATGALLPALPFLIIAPAGLLRSLQDFLSRPLQVESLGAAGLWAAHAVAGIPIAVESGFGSDNLVGSLPDTIAAIETGALVVVLATIWVAFATRRTATGQHLVTGSAAAVCAVVVLGKVLSGQYLIWLVPLVALIDGRRGVVAAATLGAALLLTQQWYPGLYVAWLQGDFPIVTWLVLARDLLLVVLVAIIVVPQRWVEKITGGLASPEPALRYNARAMSDC